MKYISVAEAAKRWQVSERTVRNYCAAGKIADAFLTGKTWNLPESSQRPDRINKKRETPQSLLPVLKAEKNGNIRGGIYHKIQIELTYNSNHMEGSRLTHEQTRFIYETNTIGMNDGAMNVDDILETVNHFRCIDLIIENATHFNSLEIIRSNNHECDLEATNANIASTLGKFKGKVAVMGGFISRDSKSRRISNLGRGGSDYTAAIVASALNASSLEIWTDVDGFMTADPKKDPNAKVIRQMTYAQAQDMCDKGAKVIYAPTIKPVAEKHIPIWVKNTFNRTALGTLITD